jgi:HEAT repeat protein
VNRLNAAANIVRIDPANATAQAVLIEFVKSKNLFRSFAIDVLGEAGPAAKPALPVVKEALRDSDKTVRQSAADAVRKIEGERRP